jgi:rhamnosyltransferase
MLAISSGMLFVLENARRMGWHDHSYFVDGVDYEFCLRARAQGLRIGLYPGTPGFDHESEQPDVPRRFAGRTWRLRKYSPHRVVDSLTAYARLALRTARRLDGKAFATVTRSASIFLLGQLLARVPLRRAD